MAIKLVNVGELSINPGSGSLTINATNLRADQTDVTAPLVADTSKIVFTIASAPAYGTIMVSGSPASSFTQADINAGRVSYIPDLTNKTQEYVPVLFTVRDTRVGAASPVLLPLLTANPNRATWNIRYVIPDRAPEGDVSDAFVRADGEVVLTQTNINFADIKDSANAIYMFLQAYPLNGDLYLGTKKLVPGDRWTQEDVIKGKLKYVHTVGNEAEADVISFKVRDVRNNWTGSDPGIPVDETNANVFNLNISIKQIDLPLEVISTQSSVKVCETITIGTDTLFASDPDDPDLPITFTITVLPTHGILRINGTPAAVGSTFTAAQIAMGYITYEQDCSDSPNDSFKFDVKHSKEERKDFNYFIRLIPNLPPVVQVEPLEVPYCETKVVDNSNITITDPEGKTPEELIIKYVGAPINGEFLVHGAPVAIDYEFTYADVLSGNISYKHNCTTHAPWTDEIGFVIIDDYVKVPFVLPINILYIDDTPPYLTVNETHSVPRNGEVNFGADKLDFSDDDTLPSDIFWELTILPLHGELYVNGVPAVVGLTISKFDWANIQFRFVATVADPDVTSDFAGFKLYDQNNTVDDLKIYFTFPAIPPVCPELTITNIVTTYTVSKAITQFELFASNEGIPPSEFTFVLLEKPEYGALMLGETEILENDTTWTSQDILDMKLSYQHLTQTPDFDAFKFGVTNGFCALEGNSKIVFMPGLQIIKNALLTIAQADTAIIDQTLLETTSGLFPEPSDVIYTITRLPRFGQLYLNDIPLSPNSTFTQEDINSGSIKYDPDKDQVSSTDDYFDFTVSDSVESISSTFVIKIILTDRPPTIVMNELVLGEMTCRNINNANISVSDDYSTDAQLVFTIKEIPVYGDLKRDGTILGIGGTFTYDDIIKGRMSYCNTFEGVLLDSFDFDLTDSGGNILEDLQFPIRITPPPPPTLTNRGMVTEPCRNRAITTSLLSVDGLRSSANLAEVIFTVTSVPTQGVLALNNVPLSVGSTFTQQDIVANTLTYLSNNIEPNPDSFDFTVDSVWFTGSGTFDIKFRIVNNPPWVCANNMLDVVESKERPITLDNLQLCDVDLSEGFEGTFETGEVLSDADSDELGRASKTLFVPTPGMSARVQLTVIQGAVRMYVRDQTGSILVDSQCVTPDSLSQVYTFTPSFSSMYVDISVQENCLTAPTPAEWFVTTFE